MRASIIWILILTVLTSAQPVSAMLIRASESRTATNVPWMAGDDQTVQTLLEHRIIRHRLLTLGLTETEADLRLSRLTPAEMHLLALQIRALQVAGGHLVARL